MEVPMPGGVLGNARDTTTSENNSDSDTKANGEDAQRRLLQRENSNNQIHTDDYAVAETVLSISTPPANNTPAPLSVVVPVVPYRVPVSIFSAAILFWRLGV